MKKYFEITNKTISLEDIENIIGNNLKITLSVNVKTKILKSKEIVNKKVNSNENPTIRSTRKIITKLKIIWGKLLCSFEHTRAENEA